MFVITVRFTVKPGCESRFLERVIRQAQDSLAGEAGCRRFDVCLSERDPSQVFLYEIYDDAAAFADHLQSPHFRAFDAGTREWVADKVAEPWTLTPPDRERTLT